MQRGKRRTAEVLLYFELPFQQIYENSDWLPTHQSVNKKSQSLGSPLSARILDVHCRLILDAVSYFFFAWAPHSFLTA